LLIRKKLLRNRKNSKQPIRVVLLFIVMEATHILDLVVLIKTVRIGIRIFSKEGEWNQ
jgi:hypothetical protein